jgi:hypothetical protein
LRDAECERIYICMNNDGLAAKYSAALALATDAEKRNLSASTQNKRWRAVFAAQDALKSARGGVL